MEKINSAIGIVNVETKIEDKFISIMLKKDKELIGLINFKFSREHGDKVAWIYVIEVKEKFQSKKFGDILINLFEDYCKKERIKRVEGKFYPTNMNARPFYLKHGYEIYKEDYETYILKVLDYIKENNSYKAEKKEDEIEA